MNRKQRKAFFVICMLCLSLSANAQSGTGWLENTMFASGKINVVVTVVAAVFVLIVIYLISIDRKLKKLEDKDQKHL